MAKKKPNDQVVWKQLLEEQVCGQCHRLPPHAQWCSAQRMRPPTPREGSEDAAD